MADGSDQYIETRYSNDKPIWEGPKAEKKEGPNSANPGSRGPTRKFDIQNGAQSGKKYYR